MPNIEVSSLPRTRWLIAAFGIGAGLAALGLFLFTERTDPNRGSQQAQIQKDTPVKKRAQQSNEPPNWTVGELRPNGLRIKPSGRSDASAVLDPDQFDRAEVRRAYRIATEIPKVLNNLYCWCGCENRGVHRSNLGCFEDKMAVDCAVCRATAEIASRMTQEGVTDAGKIQAAVDEEWGPSGAR